MQPFFSADRPAGDQQPFDAGYNSERMYHTRINTRDAHRLEFSAIDAELGRDVDAKTIAFEQERHRAH